jgi:hypothetical protein
MADLPKLHAQPHHFWCCWAGYHSMPAFGQSESSASSRERLLCDSSGEHTGWLGTPHVDPHFLRHLQLILPVSLRELGQILPRKAVVRGRSGSRFQIKRSASALRRDAKEGDSCAWMREVAFVFALVRGLEFHSETPAYMK